jgi:hypothetical protein
MPQPQELPGQKCRRKTVPALSAAGLSLALASAASAAVGGMSVDLTARTARVSQQITLRDEEIGDVSLATFHVFDRVRGGRARGLPRAEVAAGAAAAAGRVSITTRRYLAGLRIRRHWSARLTNTAIQPSTRNVSSTAVAFAARNSVAISRRVADGLGLPSRL